MVSNYLLSKSYPPVDKKTNFFKLRCMHQFSLEVSLFSSFRMTSNQKIICEIEYLQRVSYYSVWLRFRITQKLNQVQE